MLGRDRWLPALAVAASLALMASCTVFNGKSVPAGDGGAASQDGSSPQDSATPCDASNPSTLATDPNNCGACDHNCGGGPCDGGVCQPVVLATAASTGTVTDIAVDDTYVFWTTAPDGTVGRALKNTPGSGMSIASGVQSGAGLARVAVDTNRVYYRTPPFKGTLYPIFAANKDGSGQITVAAGQGGGGGGVASSGSELYWTTYNQTAGSLAGAPFAADGGVEGVNTIWPNLDVPDEIALDPPDGGNVYWSESNLAIVSRGAVTGSGTPARLACNIYINALAVDATSIYWTTDTGFVQSTNKNDTAEGGDAGPCMSLSTKTIATTHGAAPFGVAVGGVNVYYTVPSQGTVWAVPKTGGCSETRCEQPLATGQNNPTRAAADAYAVYWINMGDNTIAKVAY